MRIGPGGGSKPQESVERVRGPVPGVDRGSGKGLDGRGEPTDPGHRGGGVDVWGRRAGVAGVPRSQGSDRPHPDRVPLPHPFTSPLPSRRIPPPVSVLPDVPVPCNKSHPPLTPVRPTEQKLSADPSGATRG